MEKLIFIKIEKNIYCNWAEENKKNQREKIKHGITQKVCK